jgi:hypothetical protein
MHKNYNIISNFFSLLTNHINIVKDFNNQTNEWLLEGNDIYYEALTEYFFRRNLLSNSRKIVVTVEEISNNSSFYLNKLRLLTNILDMLMRDMV